MAIIGKVMPAEGAEVVVEEVEALPILFSESSTKTPKRLHEYFGWASLAKVFRKHRNA